MAKASVRKRVAAWIRRRLRPPSYSFHPGECGDSLRLTEDDNHLVWEVFYEFERAGKIEQYGSGYRTTRKD